MDLIGRWVVITGGLYRELVGTIHRIERYNPMEDWWYIRSKDGILRCIPSDEFTIIF